MSTFNTKRSIIRSEQGMVSIMTVMILMVVISLIVIGFSQLTRRTQKGTIEHQLSTQAFYAAETGVNDARNIINARVKAGNTVDDKNDCTATPPSYSALKPILDAPANNVAYSCLLVHASPTKLRYSDIGSTSTIIPIQTTGGLLFSKIRLDIQSKAGSNPTAGCPAFAASGSFSPVGSWNCGYGVLRFDLVPIPNSGMTLDGLRSTTMTSFITPVTDNVPLGSNATPLPYLPSNTNINNRYAMHCTNSGCSLVIGNLNLTNYYLRVSSLYKDVSLQVTAQDALGNNLKFLNAQAVIDSTGKAGDVLRRIQVNVPITGNSQNELSEDALQTSDSICKRFSVMDGFYQNSLSVPGATSRLCN